MKSYKSLLLIALFFISTNIFGQFTVTGRIIDSTTREPMQGASVFCQNTTLGTITNKEGQFSLSLKSGGYELVISYTGYQTRQIRVMDDQVAPLEIALAKEEKSLGEVVIKSSAEVLNGWEKYGKFFRDNFLGATPDAAQCVLQNPDVVHFYFYKKSNKLKVLATEPILIANNALGYNLRYQLDSFIYYYSTDISSYRGYCFFSEMNGNFDDLKKWSANRKTAYYGSKLHFMRSYYDSTLSADGFEISMADEKDSKKFITIKNPYDSTYFGFLDSTNEAEVFFPRKIRVGFDKRPEKEFIEKFKLPTTISYSISYVDLIDAIIVKENGYFYNQRDWMNQGYWSWKNIADLLPYDYIP
jgi:hypothetical protein